MLLPYTIVFILFCLSIHQLLDFWMVSFRAITNNPAIYICMQMFVWISGFNFFRGVDKHLGEKLLGFVVSSCFHFCTTVFHTDYASFHFPPVMHTGSS